MRLPLSILLPFAVASGCVPLPPPADPSPYSTARLYSAPEDSGLRGVRPYPFSNSVCQVIGESEAVSDLLDHTTTLVGCPHYEKGAIEDLLGKGATAETRIGEWMLFSIPARG